MNIKVSVVVPVYGTEKYLRKCLDSLIEQTLKPIEILVVNDGSPDNSQVIIDEYEKRYSQVHGLKKKNGGLSDARNFGIMHAEGEYVAFVDSDDYIEPQMCEIMYEKATNNNLDVVVCDTFMDYSTYSYVLKADLGYTADPIKAYIFSYPNAPARMVRTSLMKEHLFRKGIWYEDLDLMPTLAVYTDRIGFVECPLYHYLQREASIMNQVQYNPKFEDIFMVLQNVTEAFEKNDLYQKYYDELEYLYIIQLQRSAILRFSGINGAEKCLKKVSEVMQARFPNWTKNQYLKKSSWKFRLICMLGKWKQYWMIALLKKLMVVSNKL